MLVTLAYPWNGYAPDETVDVDDGTAKRLLRDGKARPAAPDAEPVEEPLEGDGVTYLEAKAYAAEHGLALRDAAHEVRAARLGQTRDDTDQAPTNGDDTKE